MYVSYIATILHSEVPVIIVNNHLKVHPCKLCSNKYMIALTQLANTEIFAFIAVLIFKLLNCKVLFISRKVNRNC